MLKANFYLTGGAEFGSFPKGVMEIRELLQMNRLEIVSPED
jgi:hypothetical protein